MARNHNTDRNGNSWSENTKKTVWNKGVILPGEDSSKVRKDTCGAWIQWDKHGDTTENGYGWEIDHKKPVAKGGDDDVNNLQPLQWQNNRRKSDDYPANNFCAVTATNN